MENIISASALEQDLQSIEAEIHFDTFHRTAYSVDASIFEILPIGIVIPKTIEALRRAVEISNKHHIPIIPRGAATGITGGCLGKGLIIDTSKYLNKILEINYEEEYAICEPGVVQDTLNAELSSKGYSLGPDTSTGNRATLGGMVANNSAGARSLLYGTMADHVLGIDLVLASGECIYFQNCDQSTLELKASQNNAEGRIYQQILRLRSEYRSDIEEHFPKIPRRASGYNLDALTKTDAINICRLIVGSEGTLGIATKIKVKICKKPACLGLCIIHFTDFFDAFKAIASLLEYHPISLELIDHRIIEAGRKAPSLKGKLDWLRGEPQAILVAEFDEPCKLLHFTSEIQKAGWGYSQISLDDSQKMAYVWELRKSGLGLLLSKRSYSRAIAFLEDISIDPKQLAPFMKKFLAYLSSKGKEAGIYGHVGSGCMHIRPYIDLRQKDEVHLLKQMMLDVTDLLLEFNGALSGEHGDGLIRSWLNKKLFGDRLYQAFLELKAAFDPENLMNPGKVVNSQLPLQDLRISPETKTQKIETFLDFSKEGGFELAADLCNGNGMCRKSEKLMCPSFQATQDEFLTTRARAQSLRSIINSKLPLSDYTSQDMHDVLDLCLECKGCKTECPSSVDMAKMKAEFLYQYKKVHGGRLRSWIFAHIGQVNKLNMPIAGMFNWIGSSSVMRGILGWVGIAKERKLPKLANQRFSEWISSRPSLKSEKQIILFNDTFTEFNQPEIGKAAVQVLEALGYSVIVPAWQCCGRPAFSKGYLPQVKKQAQDIIKNLRVYLDKRLPIIGLEPSCLLTMKDDYGSLLGQDIENFTHLFTTFDEFLSTHLIDGKFPQLDLQTINREILLHGHCHQKALVGTGAALAVLKAIPGAKVTEIPSGCCGMAGSFGYEQEHYDLSIKIGELKLFPALREAQEALVVADGFSCRCQIEHGVSRKALHLAEVVAMSLVSPI